MRKKGNCYQPFSDCGIRMTSTRKTIINILLNTKDHLTVEDIFRKAHSINSSTGLTTVYRTLDLLEQMGILQKHVFGDGKARYELSNSHQGNKFHYHLICVRCKAIADYSGFGEGETRLIESVEKEMREKFNFKPLNHVSYFYGVCGKCQKLK